MEGLHSEIGYINFVFLKSVLYSPMCLSISGFEISLDISLEVSWYFYFLRSDAEVCFWKKNS